MNTSEKQEEITKAKELLEEITKVELEDATKEFNEFLDIWQKKHNCGITPFGKFEGNQMQIQIKVIKLNGNSQ